MIHHYDHRWATYDESGDVRDVTEVEHADPNFVVIPRYWVASSEVRGRLDGRWEHEWLVGFRDICRSTDERTMITGAFPAVGVGNNLPIALASTGPSDVLSALLSSIVFDYTARLMVGGTHMNFFLLEQLPVPIPQPFSERCIWPSANATLGSWTTERVEELIYTSWDMAPAARDLGDDGPPFVWDPERRATLRAELDGAFFHLYGIDRDDAEYILSTFPIANRKDPGLATRVLNAYDRIADAIATSIPFTSGLDPPPGLGHRHPELP